LTPCSAARLKYGPVRPNLLSMSSTVGNTKHRRWLFLSTQCKEPSLYGGLCKARGLFLKLATVSSQSELAALDVRLQPSEIDKVEMSFEASLHILCQSRDRPVEEVIRTWWRKMYGKQNCRCNHVYIIYLSDCSGTENFQSSNSNTSCLTHPADIGLAYSC
jgi:hypothetical protein